MGECSSARGNEPVLDSEHRSSRDFEGQDFHRRVSMSTILGILKALLEAFPAIDRILRAFKKTPQQNVDQSVEDLHKEVDEFKKTGRPQ